MKGTQYPTVASIHLAFMAHPDIPKWSTMTTHKVLKLLGFKVLQNRDIHYGLIIENEWTTEGRKRFCQKIKELIADGYYLLFIDESYVNVHHSRKRRWHDTTIHTAKEAKDKDLTCGILKPPGRGERLIIIGAGGRDGWEECDVIERSAATG